MANITKLKRPTVFVSLDVERPLRYTLNSFAEMEERYGSVDAALEALEKGSIKAVRFMLWAGLVTGDSSLTETAIGNMIELADMEELSEKMNQVMMGDLPEQNSPNVDAPTQA